MKTIELNLYDKSTWAEGEWKTEPDKIQWRDETTGYPCLIVRDSESGVLCGYVGISQNHSLYEFHDVHRFGLHAHYDINYESHCFGLICHTFDDGEDDNVWWIGFDCNHSGDIAPVDLAVQLGWKYPPHLKDVELRISQALGKQYRNVAYVKEQCASLAMQLKELEDGISHQ